MPNEDFYLKELASRQDIKFSVSTSEDALEKATRLRIEEANAAHQRQKELLLHRLTSGVILLHRRALCLDRPA